jgi:acetylornithine deacetylase/succinyl-diaminopimelate desuccinylase-like protein
MADDPFQAYMNRGWKAQLTVVGASGLPPCDGAGNVIRPDFSLNLSLRLPPTKDLQMAMSSLKSLLTEKVPYNAVVEIEELRGARGLNCPAVYPFFDELLDRVSNCYFKKDCMRLAQGGTCPIMTRLSERFPQAQIVITGVIGPDSHVHEKNESLNVPYAKKMTCCVTQMIAESYPRIKQSMSLV